MRSVHWSTEFDDVYVCANTPTRHDNAYNDKQLAQFPFVFVQLFFIDRNWSGNSTCSMLTYFSVYVVYIQLTILDMICDFNLNLSWSALFYLFDFEFITFICKIN